MMNTCLYDPAFHAEFSSAGKLVSHNGFLHPQRCIDTYVLILVQKGTLYITQDEKDYTLVENKFILLFPNVRHKGSKPSDGELVYYWTHFKITDPNAQTVLDYTPPVQDANFIPPDENKEVILPEYGEIEYPSHTEQLFLQLIDTARRTQFHSNFKCHYLLSLMLMEFSTEVQALINRRNLNMPPRFSQCLDFIRQNYHKPINADELARQFSYNPAYLTLLFSKFLGIGIIDYINSIRVSAAKIMLSNQSLTIDTVADQCGFTDTKYFYRVFKKYEHITPGDWRKMIRYNKELIE